MKFKHYVITRFNLAVKFECPKRDKTLVERPWLDVNYLRNRFELFEKFTVPSIKNQTNHDFVWLVLFHKDTPFEFKQRIENLQKRCEMFVPIYLNDEESMEFVTVLDKYLLSDCSCKYILTSRIDNDDALSVDYVERVQQCVKENNLQQRIISFEYGIQYHLDKGLTFNYYYACNHFLSLITSIDGNDISVYNYNHALLDEYNISIEYIRRKECERPLWAEIIHSTNYSNDLKLYPSSLILNREVLKNFMFLSWNTGEFFVHCIKSVILIIQEDIKKVLRKLVKIVYKNFEFKQ